MVSKADVKKIIEEVLTELIDIFKSENLSKKTIKSVIHCKKQIIAELNELEGA